jgi:SAM-dependent methyltransferase
MFTGKRVLEVGLGYGTVAQRIAASGAQYAGLDIAQEPVRMVKYRLQAHGLSGEASCGSILACPFKNETFDYVVAIGCYHHTGNLQRALDETHRVLKVGGSAIIMIYNAYSYRRWLFWPYQSLCYWLADTLGVGTRTVVVSALERAVYDAAMDGIPAPETVFTSSSSLRNMTDGRFVCVTIKRENMGNELFLRLFPRKFLLTTLGPFMGLDLYCHLQK